MPTTKNKKVIYKIHFIFNNSVYQIYAKHVLESNLMGFIEIEDIVFDTKSSLMIDPTEEKLRHEFKNINRFYIPIPAVLRIDEMDEVEKQGTAKIIEYKADSIPKGYK